ncbi:unnamed protein product [Meganyctiphanes norvegica]|uniref:Uncharacterized protein n=1 Tax=Meganyctiphanes norvegica TaxID=48144 RepID=A0AAV2RD78_MEGNR
MSDPAPATSEIKGRGPSLESLIQKATSPLNRDDYPNAIQAVWHAVSSKASNVQTAVRLLAHKIQSPQEREAVQALAVLQACVNNCGASFHAEIGKFRFLNEMIKLVSPKYLGNHTAAQVKRKVAELLFTWTIDLPSEPKILEAYNMLKKQGVVRKDPAYLGVPTNPVPRPRDKNAVFEDEEKAKLLQKLLQSKNPEDLHKANALIKSMVKEDQRKLERASRRIVEVETVMKNCGVLDEMLSSQQEGSGVVSQSDLDLMAELHTSCTNLRANIYRLVSEMDEKEEGIGDLLKAYDELSRVMGRYRLVIDGNKNAAAASGPVPSRDINDREADTKEVLLDLFSPEETPTDTSSSTSINIINQDLGLASLSLSDNISSAVSTPLSATPISQTASLLGDIPTNISAPPVNEGVSFMDALGSVFSPPIGLPTNTYILASPLLPESSTANVPVLGSKSVIEPNSNHLDELDILASETISSLGLQNLNLTHT